MSNQLHVIVGLGATGLSCARYFHANSIPFALTDSRPNPPNLDAFKEAYPAAKLALGGLDETLLSQAAAIVISPGMSLQEPIIAAQVKRGIPVIGDIELFARAVNVPVIGITGTNAKSTVTTLVGLMGKAAGYRAVAGGNLGVPALDLLLDQPETDLFVLELSSFQLETTSSLHSRVATILNVTPDHMDRYHDLAAYQAAKQRVYLNADIVVCNRDDPLTETNASKKIYFTLGKPMTGEFGLLTKNGTTYLAFGEQPLIETAALPVMGKHYQANALASLAIGFAFGFSFDSMLTVLREFKGLPHRCQYVRERDGVRWYNDSKGTNVGATQAAIEGLGSEISGKLVLIAGGLGKQADFTTLVPVLQKFTRHVVLIGEAAQEIAAVIGDRVPYSFASDMEEAVAQCDKIALPGDSVLLSPACASWDMYKNYAHRGAVFTEIVEKLQ